MYSIHTPCHPVVALTVGWRVLLHRCMTIWAATAQLRPRRLSLGWDKHPPLPAHVHALASTGMSGGHFILAAAAVVLAAAVALRRLRRMQDGRSRRRATAVTAHHLLPPMPQAADRSRRVGDGGRNRSPVHEAPDAPASRSTVWTLS
jgi:hypothetical protein